MLKLDGKGGEGELVERSSPHVFDESIFGVYCVQRGATRGLTSECENDGDKAEVIGKISAGDNCNESR